jgi:hypothetical protein
MLMGNEEEVVEEVEGVEMIGVWLGSKSVLLRSIEFGVTMLRILLPVYSE